MVISESKVLLISHRPHVRAQLRLLIESQPGLVVVGEVGNYAGALAIAAVETPEFIVADVAADDEGALDHISDLVQATKHMFVVSDICEETLLNYVKRAGARDLVPKEHLVVAIRRHLDPHRHKIGTLSEQEMVIVDLVSKGLSNRKIAAHLIISEVVVSEVLESIFRKLEVRDRFELLIYSLLEGLARAE